MKRWAVISLSVIWLGCSIPAVAEVSLEHDSGEEILVNCHQIYTRGIIHHKVDNGYIVNFPKNSGPIQCPPYRWDKQFILHFKSIPEYTLKHKESGFFSLSHETVFRIGEKVVFRFPRNKKLLGSDEPVDIQAEIVDISDLGAISTKLLSTDRDAVVTFSQWVGSNYIDLRHEALAPERTARVK